MSQGSPAHTVHLTWSMIATGFLAYCVTWGALGVVLGRIIAASLQWAIPIEIVTAMVTVGVGLGAGLLLGRPKILIAAADNVHG